MLLIQYIMENRGLSIREIIGRIKRHPMLADLPMETIIDYTVEFIRIVGLPTSYIDKTRVLDINKYRASLPDDFIEMTQVRTLGHNPIYYRYTTDNFHLSRNKADAVPFTYKIQGHCLYVSNPIDKVEIAYQAIPVDECGLPLIPDNEKFIRALRAYIKQEYFEILFDQGKIDARVYQNAQQEYCWAVGACESDAVSLTPDKLESIGNMAKSLLIRDNEHQRGFATQGNKELIRVQ